MTIYPVKRFTGFEPAGCILQNLRSYKMTPRVGNIKLETLMLLRPVSASTHPVVAMVLRTTSTQHRNWKEGCGLCSFPGEFSRPPRVGETGAKGGYVARPDYMAMRQAFASKFGEFEDKRVPAKEYSERKLHELETGEFRAEPVLSRHEIVSGIVRGLLSSRRLPPRRLCRQIRSSSGYVTDVDAECSRHDRAASPGVLAEVKDIDQQLFEKYKYRLPLGRSLLRAKVQRGQWIASPIMDLYVLSYESAVRKQTY